MPTILQVGDSGAHVVALQQALLAANFSPGKIDGQFGNGTEAALLAYQQSEALPPTGIGDVATLTSLGLTSDQSFPPCVAQVSSQIVSQMFPVTPLGNINANLPILLDALTSASLADKAMVLMALATIAAETACFEPISEGRSRFNTSPSGAPFDLYDFRKDLGNQGPPDGANFRGRGFIQLTGRNNYTALGSQIGEDLVNNPELCNDPEIAARLLAIFLGNKETAIREALAVSDLATARRLVNGGSNGLPAFTSAYNVGFNLIS